MLLKFSLRHVLITFLALALFYSCKKDSSAVENEQETISAAKEWFLQQQAGRKTVIKTQTNVTMPLRYAPDWGNAKKEIIDGHSIIIVPVETNLKRAVGVGSQFTLIIKDNQNSFESRTVGTLSKDNPDEQKKATNKQLYDMAFTNTDVSKVILGKTEIRVFDQGLVPVRTLKYTDNGVNITDFNNQKINKSQVGQSGLPAQERQLNMKPPENCTEIEWYLQTWVYGPEGELLYFDEVYVGTTLECEGGGGPGSVYIEEEIQWGDDYGETAEITTESSSATKKIKTVGWWVYRVPGETLKFRSLERLEVVKGDGVTYWKFASKEHLAFTMVGHISGQTIEPVFLAHSFSGSDLFSTNSRIDFQDKRTFTKQGVTKTVISPTLWAEETWTAQQIATEY